MSENVSTMNTKPDAKLNGGSVVLMREGASGCAVLLSALSARGLPHEVVHDEPSAMLVLADLSRRGLVRRVLIVVEPTQWLRLDQLLSAVDDHHGSVYCWQFDNQDGADPMLSQIPRDSYPFNQGGMLSESGPIGKIRKRARPVDRLLVPAPGHEETTREVVTQQELTMLLGPAPGEAG
ncbi:MAG: hypothetical protein AB8C95_10930 [Phycisphaeraceae bacterium]